MSKTKWMLTTGYTQKTDYYKDAMALYESCQKLGVFMEAMPYKSFGSWQANAHYKGSLVLSSLKRHPTINIVWVDADALVLKYPKLFDELDCDIAGYHAEWPLNSGKMCFCSGTLFFRNCPAILELVKNWAIWSMQNVNNKKMLEQDYLGQLIKSSNLVYQELPPEYCMVVAPNPVPANWAPYIVKPGPIRDDVKIEDVVVMHTWGSRRHWKK